MASRCTKALIDLLTTLGITVPKTISTSQVFMARLLNQANAAAIIATGDTPTGNALVSDVVVAKTFSTAAGRGLVGTLVVPTVESLTADADAVATDIMDGKTAYVDGVKLTGTVTLAGLTADADAVAADIRLGKIAYVNGVKITGTATIT